MTNANLEKLERSAGLRMDDDDESGALSVLRAAFVTVWRPLWSDRETSTSAPAVPRILKCKIDVQLVSIVYYLYK